MNDDAPWVAADAAGCLLLVRVVPRAARTAVAGERAGALLVRVAAPPVEGAANSTLLEFLSDVLNVPMRRLTIVSGESSRTKRVRVQGLSPGEALERLRQRSP
jgi:uncharacterized protein (TIGR00251 family)